MARSGPGAGEPPLAVAAQGGSGPAPEPGGPDRDHKMAWGLVVLGLMRHVLRSRHFYQGVAVAAVTLASLRGISQENRANAMARLAAWNRRELQRLEHKAERRTRAVKGAGRTSAGR
jgi:hypothetical protein